MPRDAAIGVQKGTDADAAPVDGDLVVAAAAPLTGGGAGVGCASFVPAPRVGRRARRSPVGHPRLARLGPLGGGAADRIGRRRAAPSPTAGARGPRHHRSAGGDGGCGLRRCAGGRLVGGHYRASGGRRRRRFAVASHVGLPTESRRWLLTSGTPLEGGALKLWSGNGRWWGGSARGWRCLLCWGRGFSRGRASAGMKWGARGAPGVRGPPRFFFSNFRIQTGWWLWVTFPAAVALAAPRLGYPPSVRACQQPLRAGRVRQRAVFPLGGATRQDGVKASVKTGMVDRHASNGSVSNSDGGDKPSVPRIGPVAAADAAPWTGVTWTLASRD